MVICPDCGKEVPDAKFCKNCGSRLPEVIQSVRTEENDVIEPKNAGPVDSEDIEIKTVKYCHNCGFELNGKFKFCPNCGYNLENKSSVNRRVNDNYVTPSEEKNIILSIILSVIIPGLGHFYLGLSRKGAIFLLAYVVSAVLIFILIGFILVLIIWIWALVDVIQSTNALNSGESVEDKLI